MSSFLSLEYILSYHVLSYHVSQSSFTIPTREEVVNWKCWYSNFFTTRKIHYLLKIRTRDERMSHYLPIPKGNQDIARSTHHRVRVPIIISYNKRITEQKFKALP